MKYALFVAEIKWDASVQEEKVWKLFLRELQTHLLNNQDIAYIPPNVVQVPLNKTIQPLLTLLSLAKESEISYRLVFLDEPLSWIT